MVTFKYVAVPADDSVKCTTLEVRPTASVVRSGDSTDVACILHAPCTIGCDSGPPSRAQWRGIPP